jgi:hypothetical protein
LTVANEMDETMPGRTPNHSAVEALLGRMLTDAAFRRRFFSEPANACEDNGYQLTVVQLAAVQRLDIRMIERLARRLDQRIVRAVLPAPRTRSARASGLARESRRQTQAG